MGFCELNLETIHVIFIPIQLVGTQQHGHT